MISYPLRATRWTPLIVMALIALGYLGTRLPISNPSAAVETMRVVTVLLTLGCCAALDDPAAATLAASPTRLSRRKVRQAAVTLVPAGGLWLLAFVLAVPHSGASAASTGLVVEAATLLGIVWTAALVAQRFGVSEPSPVAGAVALAADLVVIGLPHPVMLFAAIDDPAWPATHRHWAIALTILGAVAAWAVSDPARPSLRRAGGQVRSGY